MKRPTLVLFLILLLAFLVRVTMLIVNYNNLDFDGSFYEQGEIASNIIAGKGMTLSTIHLERILTLSRSRHKMLDFQDVPPIAGEDVHADFNNEPGYGIFLAALWEITGSERWIYPRIIQILIDVLMCYIIFVVASQLFSTKVGIAASLFYAIFIPQIEMTIRPYRDVWVTYLFVVSIWYMLTMKRSSSKPWKLYFETASVGLFAATVCWMRSTVLIYPLALAGGLFLITQKRQWWRFSAVLLIVFVIAYAPFVYRSNETFGKPMATRGAFWHSFWGGIGQFKNPYGVVEDDKKIFDFAKSIDPQVEFDTPEYEQVLKKKAFELLRDHPLFYVATVVRRAVVIAFPRFGRALLMQKTPQVERIGALNQVGHLGETALMLVDFGIGALFVVGVWIQKKKVESLVIVVLPFLYTLVTLAPFYVTGRNIANSYCSEIIVASVGLVFVAEKIGLLHKSLYGSQSTLG
ncbi:MAG: glycosyltransferase family 39 protein [Candidatus Kryptoniota bacterium]